MKRIAQVKFFSLSRSGTQIKNLGSLDKHHYLRPEPPTRKPPTCPKLLFKTFAVDSRGFVLKHDSPASGQPKGATKTSTRPTHSHTSAPAEGFGAGGSVSIPSMARKKILSLVSPKKDKKLAVKMESAPTPEKHLKTPGGKSNIKGNECEGLAKANFREFKNMQKTLQFSRLGLKSLEQTCREIRRQSQKKSTRSETLDTDTNF